MSFAQYVILLFSWMPTPLYYIAIGVLVFASIILVFRIVRFILDCIPFA